VTEASQVAERGAWAAAGTAAVVWFAGATGVAGAERQPTAPGSGRAARDPIAAVLNTSPDPVDGGYTGAKCLLLDAVAWIDGGTTADPLSAAAGCRRTDASTQMAARAEPVECITALRPSGEWTPVTCHAGHSAPLPEEPAIHVVHTHPSGTSLSIGDLWVLVARTDIQSVSAVTHDGRIYRAERGPNFAGLAANYPSIRARVSFDRRQRAEVHGRQAGDLQSEVNAALAAAGIIRYSAGRLP
jgi:hypothetical protein